LLGLLITDLLALLPFFSSSFAFLLFDFLLDPFFLFTFLVRQHLSSLVFLCFWGDCLVPLEIFETFELFLGMCELTHPINNFVLVKVKLNAFVFDLNVLKKWLIK
jgi:hypothetical protein